jgi:hypothetical protein
MIKACVDKGQEAKDIWVGEFTVGRMVLEI